MAMCKRIIYALFFVIGPLAAVLGQRDTQNKYGLHTVSSIQQYDSLVKHDARQRLVALDGFIPDLRLDIRYATADNLMKRPVYSTTAAFLRLPAAQALKAVQEELKGMGYGLKVFDGYRPYRVTVEFYEKFLDTVFVASPYRGSRHNRGCAVDLTIIHLKTGQELSMPTPYDSFTKKAHTNYKHLPAKVISNRELLKRVMLKYGFLVYPDEWWHFDFNEWKSFPITDIPFEDLEPQ
ncbi:MAG: M15 family metallopeptidase [Chitinophagaceae bacterium]|nr:M15 family metallopeptidase [Chitinophagaceae bacterium]